jgi:hypothetical protein
LWRLALAFKPSQPKSNAKQSTVLTLIIADIDNEIAVPSGNLPAWEASADPNGNHITILRRTVNLVERVSGFAGWTKLPEGSETSRGSRRRPCPLSASNIIEFITSK